MKRFITDIVFYIGMLFMVFSMFIPVFVQELVRDGIISYERLSLSNTNMWLVVIAFIVAAFFLQIRKKRKYASVSGFLAVACDAVCIYSFWDEQHYTEAAYNNPNSLTAQFASYSGISSVTVTQTAGFYVVIAAAVVFAVLCIINLAVKDEWGY